MSILKKIRENQARLFWICVAAVLLSIAFAAGESNSTKKEDVANERPSYSTSEYAHTSASEIPSLSQPTASEDYYLVIMSYGDYRTASVEQSVKGDTLENCLMIAKQSIYMHQEHPSNFIITCLRGGAD